MIDHYPRLSNDSSSIFSNAFSLWLDSSLNLKSKQKTITVEQRWTNDSLKALPFHVTPRFISDYSTVLKWSPDSSSILDIGSYGFVPVKNSKGEINIEGGEPDTEVALIDTEKEKRTRLLYVGPSTTIVDGYWLSKDELVILGTFKDEAKTDTLMWMVDLQAKLFRLYNIRTTGK